MSIMLKNKRTRSRYFDVFKIFKIVKKTVQIRVGTYFLKITRHLNFVLSYSKYLMDKTYSWTVTSNYLLSSSLKPKPLNIKLVFQIIHKFGE